MVAVFYATSPSKSASATSLHLPREAESKDDELKSLATGTRRDTEVGTTVVASLGTTGAELVHPTVPLRRGADAWMTKTCLFARAS